MSGAQPNDSLFFLYSGHGSDKRDDDGDEVDGNDETICPVDYKSEGDIIDDEMNQILVQRLPKGARFEYNFQNFVNMFCYILRYVLIFHDFF